MSYRVRFLVNNENLQDSIRFLLERIGSVEFETRPSKEEGKRIVKIEAETYERSERIRTILRRLAREISVPETIIESTREVMPVLNSLQGKYGETEPLKGLTILVNTHLKENTGVLMFALRELGAKPIAVPVPYSRDQNTFRVLTESQMPVYTKETNGRLEPMRMDEMDEYVGKALQEHEVDLILEDGAWISKFIVDHGIEVDGLIGSIEQTKAGVTIAKSELDKVLEYPILTVGDAPLKEAAESETATPEAVVRNIISSLNRSMMGKVVTIVGFGHVGRGIAGIARNSGGRIRIVDKNPSAVLSALNSGFDVLVLEDAIRESDILITATGRPQDNPVPVDVLKFAKDGIMLVNAGSKREIDVDGLERIALRKEHLMREGITRYVIGHGQEEKPLLLVADGYPINLALGEGSPSDAIDITLSLMVEGAIYLSEKKGKIKPGIKKLPAAVSDTITRLKLESMSYLGS